MRPRKIILCVDDNEHVLSVRKFMLEIRGYRVLTANDPATALEMFRKGGIDLVLSDFVMPCMDGHELIGHMKKLAPEVPSILISGVVSYCGPDNLADAFLPKGSSPAQLLKKISLLATRKRGPQKRSIPLPVKVTAAR